MKQGIHNYSYVFPFENDWDESRFHQYEIDHWTDSLKYSAVYVVVVFGGQYLMKSRPRFELRGALACWSGMLAVFSILGSIRVVPEFITSIKDHDLKYSVCNPSGYNGVTGFWAAMFTLSKCVEFGDTLFIVLRKQKLIFLHWYHHIATFIYVSHSYSEHTAAARWYMNMNYYVHSLMYTYYSLKALRVSIPKYVNITLTSLQLVQMVIGLSINIWIFAMKTRGDFCYQSYRNLTYSTFMYFSYLGLFTHLFYKLYIAKPVDIKSKIQ